MNYIVISGVDGSGKTTVIEAIRAHFNNSGITTFYIWLRFNHYCCKVMHALARALKLSVKKPSYRGRSWFHEFYRSKLFCALYILMTYLDTVIGCLKLRSQLIRNRSSYVICDRWVPDVLVDLAVKTHRDDFLDSAWYCRFMRLMPRNAKIFLIVREPTQLLKCREENREDPDFTFRQRLYGLLQEKPEINVVDNNREVEATVESLLGVLLHGKP
jgi:thymidylate kinase